MKREIERGITRKLASNVLLRGHVDSIQPVSVIIGQAESSSTQLPPEGLILFDQVRHDLALLVVPPAREDAGHLQSVGAAAPNCSRDVERAAIA